MARYDVHTSPDGYLYVDIQDNDLAHLSTRVVIPLMPLDVAPDPARQLNPQFEVGGRRMLLVTQYMAATRLATLGPVVGSLAHEQDRISMALDRLFYGF